MPSPEEILEKTVALIPAYNELESLGLVLDNLARKGITRALIGLDVYNNDKTEALLMSRNVPSVKAAHPGYDSAVGAAFAALDTYYPECEYVLFSDAGNKYDYSVIDLFAKELARGVDMTLGNRINASVYLPWHQRLGTKLVLLPINLYFRVRLHDLGPVRMARRSLIEKLRMQPRMFRWPTESLIKSLALNAQVTEVPTKVTPRIGASKVSGNLRRSLRAGIEMFSAYRFFRYTMSA